MKSKENYFYLFSLTLFFICSIIPFVPDILTYVATGVISIIVIINYFGYHKKSFNNKYLIWITIWVSFAVISCLWAINYKTSLWILLRLIPLLVVCYSVTIYIKRTENLLAVFRSYYTACVVMLVVILLFLDFSDLEGNRLQHSMEDTEDTWNSNYIALPLSTAIYFGYFVLWKSNSSLFFKRVLYILISAMMALLIGLSGSRSGFLSFLIPICVVLLSNGRKHFVRNVVLGIALIMLIGYAIFEIPLLYSNIGVRIEELFVVMSEGDDAEGDTSRLVLAISGLEWFQSSPFLGYGINCFRVLSNSLLYIGKNFYAHNNYVELLVDVGFIGFCIYYSSIVYLIKQHSRIRKDVAPWFGALIVFLLFCDFANVAYYEPTLQFVLCIAFSIVNLYKNSQEYENS